METNVHQGQNFSDKTIEITGSVDNVVLMALQNDASITDNLQIGTVLKYSGKPVKVITDLFNNINRCATKITDNDYQIIVPDDGIGAMIIEDTFIIR